jgi:hypothetical protein
MKIEVSNGEIADKLCILTIKLKFIDAVEKRVNIQKEFDMLLPIVEEIIPITHPLYINLLEVNEALWHIEDLCRALEKEANFGDAFVQNARAVYITNDERARIKKEINLLTQSGLIEEKSYQ